MAKDKTPAVDETFVEPPFEPDPDMAPAGEHVPDPSKGVQVILDPDSAAAVGARGGAGTSIESNTVVRDKHLVELGLDPLAPDGQALPGNTVPAGGDTTPPDAPA